jgi:hypothetical protein
MLPNSRLTKVPDDGVVVHRPADFSSEIARFLR